jgi:molybdate transport system ATP-binding protein
VTLEAHVVAAPQQTGGAGGGFTLDAALHVGDGEVLAVVGPNGAGKTTLLRALAGLLPLQAGRVVAGSPPVVLDDPAAGVLVPVERRGAGVVFQDHRLFPHLTVRDNVGYPARVGGATRAEARATADDWLARFGLGALAGRRPGELSGGQAQRVALARALARRPRMLLLDEPMAALDARTRLEVRGELRRHLAGYDGPTLLVTHDPVDALVLADRVLVLEGGRVVQEGPPGEVARRPATEYVARLVGLNLYAGTLADPVAGLVYLHAGGSLEVAGIPPDPVPTTPPDADQHGVHGLATGDPVLVAVAPSAIAVHPERPGAGSPRNVWPATVTGLELLADRVRVALDGAPPALADITPRALAELRLEPGRQVWLSVKATEVVGYPAPGAPPRRSSGSPHA